MANGYDSSRIGADLIKRAFIEQMNRTIEDQAQRNKRVNPERRLQIIQDYIQTSNNALHPDVSDSNTHSALTSSRVRNGTLALHTLLRTFSPDSQRFMSNVQVWLAIKGLKVDRDPTLRKLTDLSEEDINFPPRVTPLISEYPFVAALLELTSRQLKNNRRAISTTAHKRLGPNVPKERKDIVGPSLYLAEGVAEVLSRDIISVVSTGVPIERKETIGLLRRRCYAAGLPLRDK